MADARLADLLRTAQAQGLLPADAALPAEEGRPWPIVLLTALGAWLAAVPLAGFIVLLLGDALQGSAMIYLLSALLLAGAVTVLRARSLPLFVEQLAVPALLAGLVALGFGLVRDLSLRASGAALLLLTIGLAVAIPRVWLRVLLGAAAAALATFTLLPSSGRRMADVPAYLWGALHLPLLAGLAGWSAQESWLARARRARLALALEPFAAGWLALLLAGLAGWSGMTFLAGGAMGAEFAGAAGGLTPRVIGRYGIALSACSVLLALAAARLAARDWPTLWQPLTGTAAAVLVLLAWFMPALGAVLLVLAAAAVSHRWRLAGLAVLAAVWILGAFYYQLQWSLGFKALVLLLAGTLLGGLAWIAHRRQGRAPLGQGLRLERWPVALIALALLASLAVVNLGIRQKERLIAEGTRVLVALAPVDPRSLMQGDFMRLAYRLPPEVAALPPPLGAERPAVLARRDARGVAELLRLAAPGVSPAPGEFRIELTPVAGGWTLASDAWFFAEGDAERWAAARFAEFRIDDRGRALLVGLADAQLRPIPPMP